MAADPLAVLAAEAVSRDDELRKRIARFVSNVLDEAEDLLDRGNARAKGDLISKLVPHLVRQMSEQAEDESIAKMRAEMTAMYEEMRGATREAVPDEPQPDIPVDESPTPKPTSTSRTRVRVTKKS